VTGADDRAPGCFVAVVGPSGSGKDTLIAAARRRLQGDPRFVFVRRVVTREAGGNEDHDTLDPRSFAAAVHAGAFALNWGAHGLFYGIPASVIDEVGAGRVVVANLSRSVLDDARRLFPRFAVLAVTAPVEVLADRLATRGRESRADVLERLSGARDRIAGADVTEIDNGGDLDCAVAAFVRRLVELAGGDQ
jgi:ribose 1,5-bisphosphokinase